MTSLICDATAVSIRRAVVSSLDNNVYLLTCKATGWQILIDAADEPDSIQTLLAESSLDSMQRVKLGLIVTTHQHRDHIRALAKLAGPKVMTAAGAADADAITGLTGVRIDRKLQHGDIVGVGDLWLRVISLAGHTPGSVGLVLEEVGQPTVIFTGDSLFPGGLGNTDHDPVRFRQLYRDVVEKIFNAYPDDTVIFPGHGRFSTLGDERPHLTTWAVRGW